MRTACSATLCERSAGKGKPSIGRIRSGLTPPPPAAVLLDLKTREVLALASKPNYNLQDFSPTLSQSTYDEIERAEAWLPRALHPVTHLHRPLSSLLPWQVSGKMLLIPRKLLCEGAQRNDMPRHLRIAR